jgi:2-polyprenyl-3-methyl-5-hydroxy-6-metoxy-1,4-benzoquinol methylase
MNKVPERLLPGQGDWDFSGHQHLQRYEFATRFITGGAILDWACGVGYGSYVLATATAGTVLGADIAEDALAYAKTHYQRDNLSYAQADALQGPIRDHAFDLAVSFETIEHLPDPSRFLDNVHRSLRPGGHLLLSAPNALQHSRHPGRPIHNDFHVSEPTYEELAQWIAPRFQLLREWEQTPFVNFFAAQAGVAAAGLESAGELCVVSDS